MLQAVHSIQRRVVINTLPHNGARCFSASARALADFTHTVIGAGVVGLAVGSEIASCHKDAKVLIIEKNDAYGQETSSRNSEVVHGGLYYPEDSLKTQLCIEGKRKLYELKDKISIKQCGKWVIAQNDKDQEYLEKLYAKSKRIGVPTEFISLSDARQKEPLIKAGRAVLNSPTTGITSAHEVMDYLYTRLQESDGSLALGTEVVSIKYDEGAKEYEITTVEKDEDADEDGEGEPFTMTTDTLINCAGLYAPQISNMLLPEARHVKAYYAKGNYFSYTGKNMHIGRLIYPCPTPGVASLGTHLTIDLGGQVRFGPDLEWVEDCTDYKVNGDNLAGAYKAVKSYLPSIELENLSASYCGIRPKIIGPGEKRFQDFVIGKEPDFPNFINLLGIESPGLTASLAIGDYVTSKFV